jgi:hypothetical protein
MFCPSAPWSPRRADACSTVQVARSDISERIRANRLRDVSAAAGQTAATASSNGWFECAVSPRRSAAVVAVVSKIAVAPLANA